MKKNEKPRFNKTEQKILRILYQQKIHLTIYDVAKLAGVSYPTAKKYIDKLIKEGVILED